MFSKINVNGDDAHPLWKYLQAKQPGFMNNAIKWNYTKFIVDKNGQPVKRYGLSTMPFFETMPFAMENDLLKYLDEPVLSDQPDK